MSEIGLLIREPFESVYARDFRPLVRVAMSLVDDREVAKEVVQDAFTKLYLRYSRVDAPSAYVRVCVLNGARQVLRRRRLTRRRPPEREETDSIEANHVLDVIRSLPKRQGDLILLRYDLQLTDVEIAETLNIPLGTVKSAMHRALAQLRQQVTP